MERTITFIAEHKKREYEQLKEEAEVEQNLPQEQQELGLDPESHTVD
jgi:hypothetical protein